jgi:serine/threonine-protein kinase
MRARDYQPGEQVPGTVYKVLRLIGAGGMGTVYDVEDTTIGKRYVLKTLHPKLGAREDLARRIQNEARTLARLHHPNIVEVITAGITGDSLKLPYYLMERLSGQSLRVILEKKGQIELSHAYHIGIDLLDALDHAHDKNVIHRDVKPDNIFLHRTNAGITLTKLLDFGIVSMLDQDGETAGRFLGTLRYAAPEQLRGEKPTAKTDVYAAGLVVYEMIAGRGPFDDEGDSNRVASAHLHKFPQPVSVFTRVPRELDILLMAALAKNPEARPRDAFSFAASLRNLKRAAEDIHARESTDNRVTVSAVLSSPDSGPLPNLVTSSVSEPSRSPATTLVGMPTPTHVPTLPLTAPFANSTIPDSKSEMHERAAAVTRTLAPDTMPTPQQGTESLGPLRAGSMDRIQFGEASTEMQWPRDRAPILSDEPQVRSLPASSMRRRRSSPRVLAIAGSATLVAATVVLVLHHGARPSASAAIPVVAATAVPVVAPTTMASVSVEPAPILPAASAPPPPVSAAPAAAVSVAPAASVSSPPPPRAKTVAKPRPARPAPSSEFRDDRPGPGF